MAEVRSHSQRRLKSRSRSLSVAALNDRRDYIVGICLLLVVVFLWTSSNFLTQGLFDDGYEKPFLITYLCTSSFSLYLLPWGIRKLVRKTIGDDPAFNRRGREGYHPLAAENDIAEILTPAVSTDVPPGGPEDSPSPLTEYETAKLAAWFCLIWFVANWSLNASLDYTSVASATILSSMSGFFTLGIGRMCRVETLTIVKIAAVATSFGGVVLVSLSDSSSTNSTPGSAYHPKAPLLGDTLALLSALFYALYVILLKVQIKDESRIDMQLFFGFVGLFNIVGTWPIGVILHFTGVERFELPHTSSTIVGLLVNAAITLSSDFIYVIAMLKTTPLVVTVGLSLTMPLAVIGDFILKKPSKIQVVLGAFIVLLSFVAVGLEDSRNKEEEDLISGRPITQEESEGGVRLEEDVVVVQEPSTRHSDIESG